MLSHGEAHKVRLKSVTLTGKAAATMDKMHKKVTVALIPRYN